MHHEVGAVQNFTNCYQRYEVYLRSQVRFRVHIIFIFVIIKQVDNCKTITSV